MDLSMQMQGVQGLYVPLELQKSRYDVQKIEPSDRARGGDVGDSVELTTSMTLQEINERLTTEIGKKLDEKLKAHGIDVRLAAGLDWSPEATAGRLFDSISGLYGVWEMQHPEMSEDEIVDSFEEVIRGSINLGYSQAMVALEPLELDDSVKSVAKETISLLHEKFDNFFMSLREALEAERLEADVEEEA